MFSAIISGSWLLFLTLTVTGNGGAVFEWVLVVFGIAYFIVISTINPCYEDIKKECHMVLDNEYISSKIDPLLWLAVLAVVSLIVA